MKKQGNFAKAIEELMNGKFPGSNGEKTEMEAGNDVIVQSDVIGFDDPTPIRPVAAAGPTNSVQRVERRGVEAVITEDMVIKGTINSSANIFIAGTVLGDVSSEGDVVVRGKIEGNVTAHSLSVQEGVITGDIISSGTVIVAENSSVDGNIKAERIEVNGKVAGNLESAAKIILNSSSVIEGNIIAMELSMSEGAELKGSVSVRKAV